MKDHPVRVRNHSNASSLGAKRLLAIPRPALAIAGKSITPQSLSSVPFRVVRRGESYLAFHVLDAYSRLGSIRRSSSFRTHLKKHGVDPNAYTGYPQRDRSPVEAWQPTELERIEGGQVSVHNGSPYNQELPLSGPSEPWDPLVDQFLSLPVVPSVPMVMQPELTSVVSASSPLLFAPCPRMAPDNGHYFLSPPGGSPESSSPYSSPMTSTPILTPETGSGFLTDISVQLSSCLAAQDWTRTAWQDHGIQFIR